MEVIIIDYVSKITWNLHDSHVVLDVVQVLM